MVHSIVRLQVCASLSWSPLVQMANTFAAGIKRIPVPSNSPDLCEMKMHDCLRLSSNR